LIQQQVKALLDKALRDFLAFQIQG